MNWIAQVSRTVLKSSFLRGRLSFSGDSYSSVGYNVDGPHPNLGNVIGNPAFPGETTSFGYNWVRNPRLSLILSPVSPLPLPLSPSPVVSFLHIFQESGT